MKIDKGPKVLKYASRNITTINNNVFENVHVDVTFAFAKQLWALLPDFE